MGWITSFPDEAQDVVARTHLWRGTPLASNVSSPIYLEHPYITDLNVYTSGRDFWWFMQSTVTSG